MPSLARRLAASLRANAALLALPALADSQAGMAIRAGSLGLGAELDVTLNSYLNAPVRFRLLQRRSHHQ
jgi:hypothetical protein